MKASGIGKAWLGALAGIGAAAALGGCGGGDHGGGENASAQAGPGQPCVLDEDCRKGLVCNPDKCVEPAGDAGSSGGDGAADAGPADTYEAPPAEAFWVLYGRRIRQGLSPDPGETENDLVLTDRLNPKALSASSVFGAGVSPWDEDKPAIQLTKHSFKAAGNLTCNFGCILSPDMKYIAVATGQPGQKGYTYQLGILNPKLEINITKFGKITDVADLHFAGGFLFYSKARNCFDTGKCQYDIFRRNISNVAGISPEQKLTTMAPDNDPDLLSNPKHTTYTGRFQVSEDGSTLTFLTTTIRSVKVYAWRAGNVHKLDYICENPLDADTCVGTGSQYHDNDKVGISPDGTEVVLFTLVGRDFRVRRYRVKGEQAPTFSNLVSTPAGSPYLESVCLNLKPWQHAEVRGAPVYSRDGKRIYFLGMSNCAGSSEKPWTDIMSLEVDRIGAKIGEADFVNYTGNPRDQSVENLWIHDFHLSPQKNYFVFNASPGYDSQGDPLPDSSPSGVKDTEVYVMVAKPGAEPVMITNERKYQTDAPIPVVPIPQ